MTLRIFSLFFILLTFQNTAGAKCYYTKELPAELQPTDAGDRKLSIDEGIAIIPKSVSGCAHDICSAWVKCDNGRGGPMIATRAACKTVGGKCPTADACGADADISLSGDGFTFVGQNAGSRSPQPSGGTQ